MRRIRIATNITAVVLVAGALSLPATAAHATGPVSRDCQSSNVGSTSFDKNLQCRLQEGPASHFGFNGPVDGAMGVNSWKGVQGFLAYYYSYKGPIDGAPGKNTYIALQRWAQDRGGYTGPTDGAPGANTWRGVDRANEYDYYSPGVRY